MAEPFDPSQPYRPGPENEQLQDAYNNPGDAARQQREAYEERAAEQQEAERQEALLNAPPPGFEGRAAFSPTPAAPEEKPEIGEVKMDFEALEDFAKRGLGSLYADLTNEADTYRNMPMDETFGNTYLAGKVFMENVRAAHRTFLAALDGCAADVDRYAQEILKSCEDTRRADDNVAQALWKAVGSYDKGGSAAVQGHQQAVASYTTEAPPANAPAAPTPEAPPAPAPAAEAEPAEKPPTSDDDRGFQ